MYNPINYSFDEMMNMVKMFMNYTLLTIIPMTIVCTHVSKNKKQEK